MSEQIAQSACDIAKAALNVAPASTQAALKTACDAACSSSCEIGAGSGAAGYAQDWTNQNLTVLRYTVRNNI